MRALLLAAGLGTRLRPITDHVPKCMVPIHGKPLLGYWLDLLLSAGIEPILINTHYLPDVVRAFIHDSPWRDKTILVHEDELLGTGGTILRNRDFFVGGPFMLVHADNLTRFDVQAFVDAHTNRHEGIEITMMTFDTDTPQSCGIVELDDHGTVVAFHEKSASPPGNRANAAVYIFEPTVIEFVASLGKEFIDLSTEVLPHYLGRMQTFHNANYHRDIGTPESLRLARARVFAILSSETSGSNGFKVAVIVVNFNGGDLLTRSLECIRQQSLRPTRVIVADNASSDGSADAAEQMFPEFHVMHLGRNTGFASANNAAIKAASDCEWIALVNPDAYASPDWLEKMYAAVRLNPDYDFFGSMMLMDGNPGVLDGAGDVYHISGLTWRSGHGSGAESRPAIASEIFSPCAAAALYRRDDLLVAGCFDEDYFCFIEDVDLGFRLRLMGLRCLQVPDAVIRHTGSALTGRRSDFSIYHGHRNLVWTYFKNMPSALLWLLMPLHIVMNILSIMLFAMQGHARVILRAKRDALIGLPLMWEKRKMVQNARKASTSHIWRVLDKHLWPIRK